MKLKKKVVSKSVSTKSALVKNTHRMRTKFEALGVGLLAFGTWVAPTFDVAAAERLQKQVPAKQEDYVLLLDGKNGTVARRCTGDGKLFKLGKTVFSPAVVPEAKVRVLTIRQLATALKSEGKGVRVVFKHNKEEVDGILLGDTRKPGAVLVYRSKKGLELKDVETKACPYNVGKVVRYMQTDLPVSPILKSLA